MMLGPTLRGLVDKAMAEGKAEGEAMGEAKALIKLAAARGIELTRDERDRIMSCLDPRVLDVWFTRALTVTTAREIFADEA